MSTTQVQRHASYREITGPSGYLATLTPFEGNSMSARVEQDGDRTSWYVVYSYQTAIAAYQFGTGNHWFNERHYSVTTSKHQNYTAAWLGNAVSAERRAGLKAKYLA